MDHAFGTFIIRDSLIYIKLADKPPPFREHFKEVRYRGDNAFYDKEIVKIYDERGVEFFIVADQTKKLLREMLEIEEGSWKPLIF